MSTHFSWIKQMAIPAAIVLILSAALTSCKSKKELADSPCSDTSTSCESTEDTTADNSSENITSSAEQSSKPSSPTPLSSSPSKSSVTTAPAETTAPTESNVKTLVIPEGWTVSQIGKRLEANGICTQSDYLNAINTTDFTKYWPNVVQCVPANDSHRIYRFEGYQFPNTYTFRIKQDADDVVGTMLRGAQNHILNKNYTYSGMTTDQLITLASIIELEASKNSDRKMISAILHQRLESGMQLQCDTTINYIEYFANLSYDLKRSFASYYNTYKCSALPRSPICNPGANALDAAAHPAQNPEGYLYFFSDKNGTVYFSKTLEEHEQKRQEHP